MGVDHGGGHTFVAKKFLHGADIVAVLEEMSSKKVPEGVAAGGFGQARHANGVFDGVLEIAFGDVMAAFFAAARVEGELRGREDVLPSPFAGHFGIFSVQGGGQVNRAAAPRQVLLVSFFDAGEVGICEGKSNWETAKIIGCAEETVKKHLQKIYRQLDVANRVAAVICFKA